MSAEDSKWKNCCKTCLVLVSVCLLPILVLGYILFGTYSPDGYTPVGYAVSEIRQLTAAAQAFKGKYGIYPPSKVKLCSNRKDYKADDPLDTQSCSAIDRLWPNIGDFKDIRWNGDLLPQHGAVLEGDQCLVFFLGGIVKDTGSGLECRGFARNPKDPAAEDGRGELFFDFPSDRLVKLRESPFPSYIDAYGKQLYAYFSHYTRKNGRLPVASNCASLGVWPYAKSLAPAVEFHSPDSFQIICAGPDGQFGPGTELPGGQVWTPETADQIDPRGRDDLSNFYDRPLGVPRK